MKLRLEQWLKKDINTNRLLLTLTVLAYFILIVVVECAWRNAGTVGRMKTYSIFYADNSKPKLEWIFWAHGYPFKNAQTELKRLESRNQEFTWKMEPDK